MDRVVKPSSILIVERGCLPSTDYIVRPHALGMHVPVAVVDSTRPAPATPDLPAGTLLVFVRYVERGWISRVREALPRLAGVAYFMDDDLIDWTALRGLPARYAFKIVRLALARQRWLTSIGAQLWVSSPYLAEKYRDRGAMLIQPLPTPKVMDKTTPVRIFYHGTASHAHEIRWLAPIIRDVQRSSPTSTFEIFGDSRVNRLYRDIPRVAVLHPMAWENYLAYSAAASLHVGLAPLLPGPFNAARCHTKFFDFVRCGAVGIYSDVEPYASFVQDGVDGLLVPNSAQAWSAAMVRLMGDDALRDRMAAAARHRALALQPDTLPGS
jgi:glycosyltransferase involved in cell wall biosynthesis